MSLGRILKPVLETTGALGETGVIRPEDEGFLSTGTYTIIHPDKMKPGATAVQKCLTCKPLVMFIGGARDDVYKNVLEGIFYQYNMSHEDDQDIGYGTFQTESAISNIAREWHEKGQKICLVGHSLGGDTALVVALALSVENIDIELVVTLDPVARKMRHPPAKPANVKNWVNVYVDYCNEQCNKCGFLTPNDIAIRGGPWQFCAGAKDNKTYIDIQRPMLVSRKRRRDVSILPTRSRKCQIGLAFLPQ